MLSVARTINFHDRSMEGDAAMNMLEYMIAVSPKFPLDYARKAVFEVCANQSTNLNQKGQQCKPKNYDRYGYILNMHCLYFIIY